MSANVETMFFVGEKPWHGLGTKVRTAPTSEDALHMAELDWTVKQEPVFVLNKKVDNMVANVRSNDESVLGIVSPDYKIVQNVDAFSFTDSLLGEGVTYETAGSLNKGKRIWLLAQMPEMTVLGDKTEPYMVFTNSHDGKGSIRVCMTPIRVVCQNTLNIAIKGASRSWSAIHMGNMDAKLETAKETMGLAKKYMEELDKEAERLAAKHMNQKQVEKFVTQLFPINDEDGARRANNMEELRGAFYKALEVDNIANFKDTAWGVINAVSDLVTHLEPRRNTDTFRENKFGQIINGHWIMDNATKIIKAA